MNCPSEAGNPVTTVSAFIARWQASGAAERANAYVFERSVTFHHGAGLTSTGRIDLYKRGCFVLEAKQGSDRQIPPDPPLTKGGVSEASGGISARTPWPKTLPEQTQALRAALAAAGGPATAETLARTFQRARRSPNSSPPWLPWGSRGRWGRGGLWDRVKKGCLGKVGCGGDACRQGVTNRSENERADK